MHQLAPWCVGRVMTGLGMDADKRLAARAAVEEIGAGMVVGLGTGSTAAHAIALIGERVRDGLAITAVGTSIATEAAARAAGIPILDFAGIAHVDLTIDGADEIDAGFRAIKGGGGAMVREKIVAAASRRMVVIADGSKRVARLGAAPVPVEPLPFAVAFVHATLESMGASVSLRMAESQAFRSDNGNPILDARFPGGAEEPTVLARRLDAIPGIVGHGLFIAEIDATYIAADGVVTRLERPPTSD